MQYIYIFVIKYKITSYYQINYDLNKILEKFSKMR